MRRETVRRLQVRQAEQGPGGILLRVSGELDVHTGPQLREAIGRAVPELTGGDLEVDLSAVAVCDAGGLYTLLGVSDALHMIGVRIVITGTSPCVEAVLDSTGPLTRLPLRDTARDRPAGHARDPHEPGRQSHGQGQVTHAQEHESHGQGRETLRPPGHGHTTHGYGYGRGYDRPDSPAS
ncbi:STAS domain-containing protein [Streptomyces sp. NPDC054842]